MNAGTLLVLALVLACPLMMVWMHGRAGHGHGKAGHSHGGGERLPRPATLEELREIRADVDARIAEFEEREAGDRRELRV